MKYLTMLLAGLTMMLVGCNRSSSEASGPAPAWVKDWSVATAQAKEQNKPLLIDFYATWCGPCKMMDRQTFSQAAVLEEINHWIPVKIDVDANRTLAQQFGIEAMPTTVLLTAEGKEITRNVGYLGPTELITLAKNAREKVK